MFLFLNFASSAGNIAKFGSSISLRTNYISIRDVEPKGNYLFLMANKSFTEQVMGEETISNFSCKQIPKYRHISFKLNLLADGKGRFQSVSYTHLTLPTTERV